jgi:sigma-E factor negative regulatory protein RseA
MDEIKAELTSALLDGEVDRDNHARGVAAIMDAESGERERFARYRLIGDVMRGESAVMALAVAQRVRQALRDEPVVFAPQPRRAPRWLRPAAGAALAASVAAGAVLVAPQLLTETERSSPQVRLVGERPALAPTLVAAGKTAGTAVDGSAGDGERWQRLDGALQARLNRLVIEHHEFGGRTGINGPVPHIGFVSYDGR